MPLILGANSVSGYNVANSLRFNSGSTDFLNRTPATTTNRRTWTWSGWVKRSKLGTDSVIFDAGNASNYTPLFFNVSDFLRVYEVQSNVLQSFNLITTQVFRDVSAWYHIVFAVDTTQVTSTNRIKLYVNGEQITSFSTASYPAQNYDTIKNSSSFPNYIGRYSDSVAGLFNGYISEVNFIDGQQLTPSSFGSTDTDTGVWIPKAYTGTYGTNGFYLKFANSASLGTDSSGNANNFTVNNLTSIDQTTDTPTNNFATFNSLDQAGGTLSEGNTKFTSDGGWDGIRTTIALPSSGKWYAEFNCTVRSNGATVGVLRTDRNIVGDLGADSGAYVYNSGDGQKYNNGVASSYGATWTTGDIIGIAWDSTNNSIIFYKNGTSQGTAWSNLVGEYSLVCGTNTSASFSANYGNPNYSANSYQDANGFGNFSYQVPSGYYSLNSKNLANFG